MKSKLQKVSILSSYLIYTAFIPACFADASASLGDCMIIESNSERLACYDTAMKRYKHNAELTKTSKGLNSQKISKTVVQKKVAKAIAVESEPKVVKQAKTQTDQSNFGMEFADQDAKVESFLVGEFTSWKKGMKLNLKNGQIWKVINARSGYRKMTNPAITISRGFFGSFDAKIEGLNSRAKVKRIK